MQPAALTTSATVVAAAVVRQAAMNFDNAFFASPAATGWRQGDSSSRERRVVFRKTMVTAFPKYKAFSLARLFAL